LRRFYPPLSISITKKGLVIVLVPLLAEVAFVGVLFKMNMELRAALDHERYRHEVLVQLNELHGSLMDLCVDGVMSKGQGSGPLAQFRMFKHDAENVQIHVNNLRLMMKDDKPNFNRLEKKVQPMISEQFDRFKRAVKTLGLGNMGKLPEVFQEFLGSGADMVDELRSFANDYKAAADADVEHNRRLGTYIQWGVIAFSIFNVVLTLVAALFFGLAILRRMTVVERNADNLPSNEPLEVLDGDDELNEVDRCLAQIRKMLKDAELRDSFLVENTADMICSVDANHEIVSANAAFAHCFGLSVQQCVGRNLDDFVLNRVVPDLNRVDNNFTFKLTLLDRENAEVSVKCSASKIGDGRLLVVLRENLQEKLQEQQVKAIEEQLSSMLGSLHVPLLIADKRGSIRYGNPAVQALLEANQSNLSQATIFNILSLRNSDVPLQQGVLSGQVPKAEATLLAKSGAGVRAEIHMRPVNWCGVDCVMIAVRDMRQVLAAENAKTKFADSIRSDTEAPLAVIGEVLDEFGAGNFGVLNENGARAVKVCASSVKRLKGLLVTNQ
jgi:PAS domain S-box-containing protein